MYRENHYNRCSRYAALLVFSIRFATRTPNRTRISSSPERSEGCIEKTTTIGVLDTLRYSCSRYASLLEHRTEPGFRVDTSEASGVSRKPLQSVFSIRYATRVLDTLRYSNTDRIFKTKKPSRDFLPRRSLQLNFF